MIEYNLTDGIGRLTIENPPVNILTREVLGQLREHLAGLEEESTLRVLLLDASGKHFSAGADVGEHLPPVYEEMIPEFIETIAMLARFPLPIVAGVQGKCLGGGFELVQPADIIVAADDASFGQPEIMLGVTAPAASVMLPRLLPRGAASQIIYTGDPVSAERARELGLVAEVVSRDDLATRILEIAGRISRHSAAALRSAKRTVSAATGDPATALKKAGYIYISELMKTTDALEGLSSFTEKRKPEWSHN